MKVNLFDSNFQGQPCSVAFQQSRYIEYARGQTQFDGVTIFTDEWINNPIVDEVESRYKIGWLHEPYCLHPETYEKAWDNRLKFNFTLTYRKDFLVSQSLYRFAPYAGTWINQADWGIKPKTKLCSMLIGSKMSTEGHIIRHAIADMIESGGFDPSTSSGRGFVDFYGVRGESVGYGQETKYKVLSDYCFSIVTETCREDNLFTEWLLDCFALGTIPIFWGAPNIHEFFDPKGILQFDTVDRLFKLLAGLSWKSYTSRLESAYENLARLRQYAITEDWIYENVLKELE